MKDDTISRAAAIDALNGLTDIFLNNLPPTIYKADAVEAVKALPPAQPEIVRCKDCKEFRRWIDTDITFCDCTEYEVKADDFCSKAERRTDG